MQTGQGGQHVAVCRNRNVLRLKHLLKKPTGGQRREPPKLAPIIHILTGNLTDPGHDHQ